MSPFEIAVLAALVIIAGLVIFTLIRVQRLQSTADLNAKLDLIDQRLGDSIAIVQLGLSGLREESYKSSSSLREEIGSRIEQLSTLLTTTIATLGRQQSERLDGFAVQLGEARTASDGQAKSLREELVASFDKLSSGLSTRMVEHAAEQTRRFDSFSAQLGEARNSGETQAKALREELVTSFGKFSDSTSARMSDQAAEQTRRFDSFGLQLGEHRTAANEDAKALRNEVIASLNALGRKVADTLENVGQKQAEALGSATTAIKEMAARNESRQDALRQTVEGRLDTIRTENADKLEQMRVTVDEKLQGTLEQRLGASFSQVNENLERVFKSVGEMQALATGVGDLKRVLSNIKVRGTWGEGTLGLLLEQVLTPEQYSKNVEIQPGSNQRVEYAIRLPGTGDESIWLPIDVKMPQEDYDRLVRASEAADPVAVDAASKSLERSIMVCAKDICSKYIQPPYSTDFGVMFLPTEGLFAEVVRRPGLVDKLQRECRVVVTGPTTLMALLNSLRMGFRSLAIQKQSSEVWQVLGAVKTAFGNFEGVLDTVEKKLGQAQRSVEDARKKSKTMNQKLRRVDALPESQANDVLALTISGVTELEPEHEAAE